MIKVYLKSYKIMPEDTKKERFGGIELRQLIVPLLILILIIGTVIGIYNYQKTAGGKNEPKIEIYKPSQNLETSEDKIIIEGKTDKNTKVVVAEKEIAVDSSGNFASEVALSEGVNVITVKSTKKNGKEKTVQVNVTKITPLPVANDTTNTAIQGKTSLDSTGPENFWLPEAAALAAAGTSLIASRRALKRSKLGRS